MDNHNEILISANTVDLNSGFLSGALIRFLGFGVGEVSDLFEVDGAQNLY